MNELHSTTNVLQQTLQRNSELPTVSKTLTDLLALHKTNVATLAKHLNMPRRQLGDILSGRRPIRAADALLFEAALGTCAEYWMALQAASDIRQRRERVNEKGIRPIWEVKEG